MNNIMNEFPLNSPSSLMTPNTIKTIEQSILASLEETTSNPQIIASQATGSFLPPLPTTTIITSNWQGGQMRQQSNEESETNSNYSSDEEQLQIDNKKPKRGGRRGGRRRLSDDGDERRKVRRERNKLAAARCRKRRVDHTNMLLEETEELESKRRFLQDQISTYQSKKEEFEFLLQAHLPTCIKNIKQERLERVEHVVKIEKKPRRPNTLVVGSHGNSNNTGISITTPSTGLNIGFEMDWFPSTGLTPTVTSVGNLTTPLVTPSTANAILASLNSGKYVSL